jgi:predicted metal-dependent hydrolase
MGFAIALPILRLPILRVAEKRIHQFVTAQQAWIMTALNKIAERQPQRCQPVVYGEGTTIVYQGESYTLTLKASPLKRIKIQFTNEFIAFMPDTLIAVNHSEAIKTALVNWMKKQWHC